MSETVFIFILCLFLDNRLFSLKPKKIFLHYLVISVVLRYLSCYQSLIGYLSLVCGSFWDFIFITGFPNLTCSIFTYPTLYSLSTLNSCLSLVLGNCQHSHHRYCFSAIFSISFWNSSSPPRLMLAYLYLSSWFLNYFSCFESVFAAFGVNSSLLSSNSLLLSLIISNLKFLRSVKTTV